VHHLSFNIYGDVKIIQTAKGKKYNKSISENKAFKFTDFAI